MLRISSSVAYVLKLFRKSSAKTQPMWTPSCVRTCEKITFYWFQSIYNQNRNKIKNDPSAKSKINYATKVEEKSIRPNRSKEKKE